MIHIHQKQMCDGCFACKEVCPRSCITMVPDSEGFLYPIVDSAACIECGACESVCPILNPTSTTHSIDGFACVHHDTAVRLDSSSGGVFTSLAQGVLARSGVVYGASFNNEWRVVHEAVEYPAELDRLRGSKYTQSSLETILPAVESDLKAGKQVLFTGTPCQVAGLKAFLGRDYDNLLCADLICHGVPSPAVWQTYVRMREHKANSKVVKISFRDKRTGWRTYSTSMEFTDGHTERQPHGSDPYMRLFLSNTILRPSCHACAFKNLEQRASDITLADLWGARRVLHRKDDDTGISLVIVHTEKGRSLLESVFKEVSSTSVDIGGAVVYNPAARGSSPSNVNRTAFFKDFTALEFPKVLRRYASLRSLRYYHGLMALVLKSIGQYVQRDGKQAKRMGP